MYVIIFVLTIRGYFLPEANIPVIIAVTTLVFTLINFRGISEAIKLITAMNLAELVILIGVAVNIRGNDFVVLRGNAKIVANDRVIFWDRLRQLKKRRRLLVLKIDKDHS